MHTFSHLPLLGEPGLFGGQDERWGTKNLCTVRISRVGGRLVGWCVGENFPQLACRLESFGELVCKSMWFRFQVLVGVVLTPGSAHGAAPNNVL
jgi:hypothetical protein